MLKNMFRILKSGVHLRYEGYILRLKSSCLLLHNIYIDIKDNDEE